MSDEQSQNGVRVKIGGVEYPLWGDNHDTLRELAKHVDREMNKVDREFRTKDRDELVILTALNIAYEVLQLREDLKKAEQKQNEHTLEMRALIQRIEQELKEDEDAE